MNRNDNDLPPIAKQTVEVFVLCVGIAVLAVAVNLVANLVVWFVQ